MSISIDHKLAGDILTAEHRAFKDGQMDDVARSWKNRVDKLSELCPYRRSSTFIAALGTAILAKSVDSRVDVLSLLDRDVGDTSYSARSLADNVWAKKRAVLEIDLGANGANPLNNTPFIGKARIDEIENVRNKEGHKYLMECLRALSRINEPAVAKSALRGFISSRFRTVVADFSVGEDAGDYLVTPTLVQNIRLIIEKDSEDGRVAQAVAAGLLSIALETCEIEVGHINDPDRNFPLDIVVREIETNRGSIRFAVEVKDKPVDGSALMSSLEKAQKFDVRSIVFLAISKRQDKSLDFVAEHKAARDRNCRLVVFTDWSEFVKAAVLLSQNKPNYYLEAYKSIGNYLLQLGVSRKGIDIWESMESDVL